MPKPAKPIIHPILGMILAIPFPGIGMILHGQVRKGLSCLLSILVCWILLFFLCAVLIGIPLLPIFFIYIVLNIIDVELIGFRYLKGKSVHTHQYALPFLNYILLPPIMHGRPLSEEDQDASTVITSLHTKALNQTWAIARTTRSCIPQDGPLPPDQHALCPHPILAICSASKAYISALLSTPTST
ncbi:hypothetical protein J8273_3938 [Carpediemonas membranifera]|uniref:Uncharacterized protein n=1 Tax=Carpediemonas membranifera TaxID=201153 RepID=A0A8J6B6U8_9EUKA|nr:hypothetical protein J8273_3938 [Carpediemonas membranifera]|eukprot:KAG9394304.1 hypothetical protein J8273_3938 [Carpediemonas membranifera]